MKEKNDLRKKIIQKASEIKEDTKEQNTTLSAMRKVSINFDCNNERFEQYFKILIGFTFKKIYTINI